MTAYLEASRLNTNSIGRVVTLFLVAPYLLQPANPALNGSLFQFNTEKIRISSTQGTGNIALFQENLDNYYKIYTFAKTFLQKITDTPPEFDEFFKENFWDLLA